MSPLQTAKALVYIFSYIDWHRNNYCHKIEFDKRELIKNHVGTNTNG